MTSFEYFTNRMVAAAGSLVFSAVLLATAIAPATQNAALTGAIA
ncbi:hypothetical protein [Pontixanthobacter aquaemixtae]|nr:hypothetical protein [Pontixanthobacter aquaemixtae]